MEENKLLMCSVELAMVRKLSFDKLIEVGWYNPLGINDIPLENMLNKSFILKSGNKVEVSVVRSRIRNSFYDTIYLFNEEDEKKIRLKGTGNIINCKDAIETLEILEEELGKGLLYEV